MKIQSFVLIHKKTENISNALEEPILILVINSGITLVSKYFSEAIAADELLIGGFITAINAFAEEAFSTKDSIDRIKYKDFTIAIKNINKVIICYAFNGPSFSAMQKMDKLISRIQALEFLMEVIQNEKLICALP